MGPSRTPKWSIEIFEDDSSCDGSESRDLQTPELVDKYSEEVTDSEREQSDYCPPSPDPYATTLRAALNDTFENYVEEKSASQEQSYDENDTRDAAYRNSYSRQVSAATAVHIDEQLQDPFAEDYTLDESRRTSDYARDLLSYHESYDGDEYHNEDRNGNFRHRGPMSETFSALPEELDIPETLDEETPPSPINEVRTPISRRYGSNAVYSVGDGATLPHLSDAKSSASRNRKGLHSTPRYYAQLSPESRSGSVQHHPSAFRNPSSVIAMQLSSPSPPPFAHPSRSGRHKRGATSMSSTKWRSSTSIRHPTDHSSAHSTPSRSRMKKEHPLILLHCTISHMHLPYSPSVVQKVLPAWVQQNEMLLREKLNPTILERGLLVPHPGEDYEVLEERILESLELKCPRVGKCGHFLGDGKLLEYSSQENKDERTARDRVGQNGDDLHVDDEVFKDPMCLDCGRHVASGIHGTSNCQDHLRKWDVRVYASNGLMRAGAWSAAWREMEMVDVEVGIWIPESLRRSLEQEAVREWEEHGSAETEAIDPRQNAEDLGHETKRVWSDQIPPPAPEVGTQRPRYRSDSGRDIHSQASTAACSRRSSANRSSASNQRLPDRLPLSTLLVNYFTRTVRQRPDVILALSFMALAIAYLLRSPNPVITGNEGVTQFAAAPLPLTNVGPISNSVTGYDEPVPSPDETEQSRESFAARLGACTFHPSAGERKGMTVLPADVAKTVLDAMAIPPTQPSEGILSSSSSTPSSSQVAEMVAYPQEHSHVSPPVQAAEPQDPKQHSRVTSQRPAEFNEEINDGGLYVSEIL